MHEGRRQHLDAMIAALIGLADAIDECDLDDDAGEDLTARENAGRGYGMTPTDTLDFCFSIGFSENRDPLFGPIF